MSQYYFLATLLPPLKIGNTPEISSNELDFFLRLNLSTKDFDELIALRRYIDLHNIRQFWSGKSFVSGGNFDEFELEEALINYANFPKYIFEFMDEYSDSNSRLSHFDELLESYFRIEQKKWDGFLAEYVQFEWQFKYMLALLRAKAHSIPYDSLFPDQKFEELSFNYPFLETLYQNRDSQNVDFIEPFDQVAQIFYAKFDDPFELHKAIQEWRFEKIDELVADRPFSLCHILGYIVQLQYVEEWLELDKIKGLEIVKNMTQNEKHQGA